MTKSKVAMIVSNPQVPHNREDYERIGADFVNVPCETEDEIVEATKDADFVITMMKPISRRAIENMKQCRMIYNLGTGYEAIDLDAATDNGICVSFPGGYCSQEVAEHTMGLILACARKICRLDRAVRAGKWDSYEKKEVRTRILPPMFQLSGQTLGLVGFGRIAQKVVPMARGFKMRILAYDPYVSSNLFDELGVKEASLDYIMENSDFISIHAAFTQDSKHMFNAKRFKKMKNTAYLINCARGDFIDEKALCRAVEEGEIAGAGLDVLEKEGIRPDHPILQLENITITPHTAFYSMESRELFAWRPFEDVSLVMKGFWPKCLINPAVKEVYTAKWGPLKDAAEE
ncbi:MAG: C-terminal binding protein [Desulfobacteraceae bacterium]|nr:C-terminal binding protein [Desulfobacteraceae bacterium]